MLVAFSTLGFLFASDAEYVYWTTPDRFGVDSFASNTNDYLAHKYLKKGTRVRLTVNGVSKDYTVRDYTKDRNAIAAIGIEDAKSMGFYYTGKELCDIEVLGRSYDSETDEGKWYNITGLIPRSNSSLVDLVGELKKQGYKVEVNTSDYSCIVKYIPEYLLEHEMETLRGIASRASKLQSEKTSVIL